MHLFKTGDAVRVTFQGRTVDALVERASGNGKSLILCFLAMLGGYVAHMPILWDDDRARFEDLIEREHVVVVPTHCGRPICGGSDRHCACECEVCK